ncbi:GIY-YIG nuclease family protein [Streptomyces sp. NPDC047108]|uniref:GIY-YIG nuclease family protein n=1 Tax=Streptomyces sp. NPDC047108 TaxID=3155025 RepID=UPI00340DD145
MSGFTWTGSPWALESELISQFDLPLNLDQNQHNAFHGTLKGLRAEARQLARELPVSASAVGLTSPADINGGERWRTDAVTPGSTCDFRARFRHAAPQGDRTPKSGCRRFESCRGHQQKDPQPIKAGGLWHPSRVRAPPNERHQLRQGRLATASVPEAVA